ncbi:MAG: rhodanese-like domain-containing protein [Thiohalophilus sp.]|uniref:rhodanese-like domain-containing protein n=1 Tax=Thiohalophilus sp. TaxID=3028392 RepID=UPI0028705B90|nr:rhodanese-like domain-containing protein [Thiohalophilus sp.]MDR9435501.1 rhodanese-like domain-containing protein [Thiohalophilus sp.]
MCHIRHNLLRLIILFVLSSGGLAIAGEEEKIVKHIPGVNKVDAEGVIDLAGKFPGLLIIDSRIVSDRAQGYIEGSRSLPDIDTDCENLARIIPDMDHPTLFYCNGPECGRSARAVKIAMGCGYSNLHWFFGGFEEWQEKNYPYIKK